MITLAAALDGQMNGGKTVHDSHGKRPSGDAVGSVGEREHVATTRGYMSAVGWSESGGTMDGHDVLYDV